MKASSAKLSAALDACAAEAQREFDELLDRLDASKPVECKAALLVAVPAIVEKHGNLAAVAAAEHYAAERRAVLGEAARPLLAQPVERGAVQAKVRYALRYLFGGEDDQAR